MSRIASCKIALTESGFCRPAGRAPLFPRGRELPGALDRLAPNHYNGFVVLCSGGAVPPELFFCPGAGAARLSLKGGRSAAMLFLLLALLSSSVLALVLNGTANAMSKVFAQLGRRQDDGLFMFYIFLFAGLATLVLLVRQHRPLTRRDVLFGVAAGVPNFLSSRLLLAALTRLPAFLVYPCYSVGVILVISAASFFLFRERLNRRQLGAAGMILGALVLLNL